MLPKDRLVCALVEDKPINAKFEDWPLHVTILPWFRSKQTSPNLISGLEKELSDIKPFESVVGASDKFGYRKDKLVNLIELPSIFLNVEKVVRQFIKKEASWLVDESTRKRHEYRPHVTIQKTTHLSEGDKFNTNNLYLVEQKGRYKEIVGVVKLAHE